MAQYTTVSSLLLMYICNMNQWGLGPFPPSTFVPSAWVGSDSRQGEYDLTVLNNMEGAFPPKRTTSNIYRDNRYDADGSVSSNGRDKGPMSLGETRDSLDRLAVSTSDKQRLSRFERGYSLPCCRCLDMKNRFDRSPALLCLNLREAG